MIPCVLKIGGSVALQNLKGISSVATALKNVPLGIVVGGGKTAELYVTTGRSLGLSEFALDLLGIRASRLNALLVAEALGASVAIPKSVEDAAERMCCQPVVMGGTVPGHTTNAVAALLAEATGARLVNVTNVDGVYDKDPNKHSDAKKLSRMSHAQLTAMAAEEDKRTARGHFVFDLLAAKIIERSKIEAHVVPFDATQIKSACLGKKHSGTVIG
jgi:uridylate kinase